MCYPAHEDVIDATSVAIPFHQRVSFSQTDNPLFIVILLGKDIIIKVVPDLCDPCIRTNLSRLSLRTEV
jgi:hypothetical protein